jgi:LPS-assembly protein
MNSGHFTASYTPDNGSVFNLGYSFRRPLTTIIEQPVTEEAHASAYFPLDDNWRLFAAINYSMEANTSVEDMAGVEYDTCCWKVRLLHLRYYENVTGTVSQPGAGALHPDTNRPQGYGWLRQSHHRHHGGHD